MNSAEERKPTIQRMRAMFLEGQRPVQIIDYLLDQGIVSEGNTIICILFFRQAFFVSIRSVTVIGASRRFEGSWSDADIDQELSAAIEEKLHKWAQLHPH